MAYYHLAGVQLSNVIFLFIIFIWKIKWKGNKGSSEGLRDENVDKEQQSRRRGKEFQWKEGKGGRENVREVMGGKETGSKVCVTG